jgi:hypothetical protein
MPLNRNRLKRRGRLSIGKCLFCGQLLRRQPATSCRRWSTGCDSYLLAPYIGRGDPITSHNLMVWGSHQEIESEKRFVAGLSFVQRRQSLLLADGLMTTLYFATPPQRPYHSSKVDALFVSTFFKRGQIFRVLGQRQFHSVIDHVRNGTISCGRLQSQGSMNLGFEINGSSFW